MNSRLRDYRLLWRAAISHGNPFGSVIVRFGLPVLVLVALVAQWATHGAAKALIWAWIVVWLALLATWAYRFVPGAVQLAAPDHAKLVPRARGRLVEMFCLIWFAGVVGVVLPSYADGGYELMLFWCVGLTLGSALSAAGHQAGTPVLLAAFGIAIYGDSLPPDVSAALSEPGVQALVLLLSLGLAVLVARLVFPEAGERHWRMVARRARMADLAVNPGMRVDKALGPRSRRWYAAMLRRDNARRDSRSLLLHALGNTHHVDDLAMGLGVLSAVVFALGTFIGWRVGAEVVLGIGWLFACSLLAVPFAISLRMSQLVALRAGEQALVRLAPAMPSTAPDFNRHFALALLRHGFTGWALATAAALLVGVLAGTTRDSLVSLACVCCLMLPMVAAPLRDYAKRGSASAMLPIVLLLASMGVSVILGFSASPVFGSPVLPVAALVSLVFASIAIRHGLRVMERAPVAFPAGRMD
ncbi:hypothetical protein [Massilia agri]|uniref:FUSC family protein n=1 Tax=Massilia agri TaxID=1886785 RepID=A0ABT2AK87_9BURK|nr:hypothetical protein [Massilia agri]MCS0596654.1 hypothetical protein [Massilia agri]